MKEGFRQSMAWLHTWSGLLVGWVLRLIFMAGTSSYYRDEITLWMTPDEIRACPERHRSPLLLACLEDYLAGQRHPLTLVHTDPSVTAPGAK